ncbi:MAG TPA: acyltransferase [Steroidobacteraceae bacterium]|jgi:peptidoglycan/LPS O-acetylase OafA/YrhL
MKFRTVQALRAIAALLVVLYHALQMWGERVDPTAPGVDWTNGAAGVDIFFVISGFVMAISARDLFDQEGGWLTFLRHRVVRIVPFYWFLTTLKLAAVFGLSAWALRSETDFSYVAASYLFLPVIDHAGHFRPLLPVGWTLTFEFLFYAMFAIAIALRVDALRMLAAVLTCIAAIALLRSETWPTWTLIFDTIVLEFLFGVALANAFSTGWKLSPQIAAGAVVGGFATLLLFGHPDTNLRFIVWGLPALAIVAGAVSLEREIAPSIPKTLLRLGDASYSLYLSHGFVLPMIGIAIGLVGWSGVVAQSIIMVVCLAACSLIAFAIYYGVEKPMLAVFRRRQTRVPA